MLDDMEELIRKNTPHPENADDVLSRLVDILDSKRDYIVEALREAIGDDE